jgi:hypothetical protein
MNIVQNGINAVNNITPVSDNYKIKDEYRYIIVTFRRLMKMLMKEMICSNPLEELKYYAALAYYTYGKDNLDTFDENLAAANLCLIAREDENDIDEVLIALLNPLEKGIISEIPKDFYLLKVFLIFISRNIRIGILKESKKRLLN